MAFSIAALPHFLPIGGFSKRGHRSRRGNMIPHTAGVGEDHLKNFLDSVGRAGIV
jgi:hypothetical protein